MDSTASSSDLTVLGLNFQKRPAEASETSQRESEAYTFSNVQGVLQEIHVLARASSSTHSLHMLEMITPFLSFIDKYALAIDSFCQFNPAPSALIWGSLRVILQIAQSATLYSGRVLRMVGRFGSHLAIYSRYEGMFENSVHFQTALKASFMDAVMLLRRARDTLLQKGQSWLMTIA